MRSVTVLMLSILLGACASWAETPPSRPADDLPELAAADPTAAPVTADRLLESERFWPYLVGLSEPLKDSDREIPRGTTGVLIRVEPRGIARIDFGRDGLHDLAVASTDLVERANQVRLGEIRKTAPNLTLAIGPRLIGSDQVPAQAVRFVDVLRYEGFLTVFADPSEDSFDSLAAALAPVAANPRVLTIVIPNGMLSDAGVLERLRQTPLRAPFVFQHLRQGYTRSLLRDTSGRPWVALQTAEGRMLFESGWTAQAAERLRAAIDAEFPTGR
jgi:hypothetical protein